MGLEKARSRVESLLASTDRPRSRGEYGMAGTGACRPWDAEDFAGRVGTFAADTWLGKPAELSPLECARRGWVNSALDTLTCPVCSARVSFVSPPRIGSSLPPPRPVAEWREQLNSKHTAQCPWRNNPAPLSLCQPPAAATLEFSERLEGMLEVGGALPRVSTHYAQNENADVARAVRYLQEQKNAAPGSNEAARIAVGATLALHGWHAEATPAGQQHEEPEQQAKSPQDLRVSREPQQSPQEHTSPDQQLHEPSESHETKNDEPSKEPELKAEAKTEPDTQEPAKGVDAEESAKETPDASSSAPSAEAAQKQHAKQEDVKQEDVPEEHQQPEVDAKESSKAESEQEEHSAESSHAGEQCSSKPAESEHSANESSLAPESNQPDHDHDLQHDSSRHPDTSEEDHDEHEHRKSDSEEEEEEQQQQQPAVSSDRPSRQKQFAKRHGSRFYGRMFGKRTVASRRQHYVSDSRDDGDDDDDEESEQEEQAPEGYEHPRRVSMTHAPRDPEKMNPEDALVISSSDDDGKDKTEAQHEGAQEQEHVAENEEVDEEEQEQELLDEEAEMMEMEDDDEMAEDDDLDSDGMERSDSERGDHSSASNAGSPRGPDDDDGMHGGDSGHAAHDSSDAEPRQPEGDELGSNPHHHGAADDDMADDVSRDSDPHPHAPPEDANAHAHSRKRGHSDVRDGGEEDSPPAKEAPEPRETPAASKSVLEGQKLDDGTSVAAGSEQRPASSFPEYTVASEGLDPCRDHRWFCPWAAYARTLAHQISQPRTETASVADQLQIANMVDTAFDHVLPLTEPAETFFKSAPGTQAVPLIPLGSCTIGDSFQVTLRTSGLTRFAGVRLETDTEAVIDILVPDAFIVNVRVYSNEAEAPPTDATRYYNTRAVVGDSFADLCNLFADGIKWQGLTVVRETRVEYRRARDGSSLEIITHNCAGPALRAVVLCRPFFQLMVYSNDHANGPMSSAYSAPNWRLVSHDSRIGRKECLRFNDGHRDRTEYSTYWTREKMPGCRYIGFGEKGGANLCMQDTTLNFVNLDNYEYNAIYGQGPTNPREPLYQSNPLWLEAVPQHPAVGVFLDTVSPSFIELNTQSSRAITIGTLVSRFHYYVMVQDSSYEVLKLYYRLVGSGHLFPKWTLGYHQGKYGWRDRQDAVNCASKFQDYRIPIDGFNIDIDLQNNLCTFTVNDRFRGVFGELKSRFNIKTSTNITPFIKEDHPAAKDVNVFIPDFMALTAGNGAVAKFPEPYRPWIGHIPYENNPAGKYPDFGNKDASSWWQAQYDYLIREGLDFVWQDMVTPDICSWVHQWRSFPWPLLLTDNTIKCSASKFVDSSAPAARAGPGTPPMTPREIADLPRTLTLCMRNQYALNLLKSTYYGWDRHPNFENRRPFIIGRGGCSGMHRFGALWTGDNSSTWDFLRCNVVQCLSLGMSGQFMSGADIGGFAMGQGEQWIDPCLMMRWHMAANFLPWYRNHYDGHLNSSGNSAAKLFQEVWAFEENKWRVDPKIRFMYENVMPVCKYYIELRYQLIQLMYDCMFTSVRTGLPISRPLFLQERTLDPMLAFDQFGYNNTQYFVGMDIMVAPFLERGTGDTCVATRNVYLPNGSRWYQYTNVFCPLDRTCDKVTRQFIAPGCPNPPFQALLDPQEGGTTVQNYRTEFRDVHEFQYEMSIPYMLPMYIRAGAIVPVAEPCLTIRSDVGGPVTINVFPGVPSLGTCGYNLYLDDDSRAASPVRGAFDEARGCKDQYKHIRICNTVCSSDNVLTMRSVRLTCVHNKSPTENRWLVVALLHDRPHNNLFNRYSVEVTTPGGQTVEPARVADVTALFNNLNICYTVDNTLRITYVRLAQAEPKNTGEVCTVRLVLRQVPLFEQPNVLFDQLHDGYWVDASDLSQSGRPDIVAYGLQRGEMMLYRNLGNGQWAPPRLIQKLEGAVATDHYDITGNGLIDLVTCYQYGPNMIHPDVNGGKICWLENPGPASTAQWATHYIGKCISMHRLRVGHFTDTERVQVLGLPIVGAQEDLHNTPVTLCLFTAPRGDIRTATEWEFTRIEIGKPLHIIHEVALENLDNGLQAFTLACYEGLIRVQYCQQSGTFSMEHLTAGDESRPVESKFRGCGNVNYCRINGVRCIATVEPFHGNVVAFYTPDRDGDEWVRHIVDIYGDPNSLEEGPAHHIIAADIDHDGNDEILVAARGPHPYEGVFVYKCGPDMSAGHLTFTKYQLSTASAARIAVADYNGNGSLGIATVGYDVPGYYEDPDSQVVVINNTGRMEGLHHHPLTRMTEHPIFRVVETERAADGSIVVPFSTFGSSTNVDVAMCTSPFVLSSGTTGAYSLQFFSLAPRTRAFIPGMADGQTSYIKQILGDLNSPRLPMLLRRDQDTRSVQLLEPFVESGGQGSVFAVFTKLSTAPEYISDARQLSWCHDQNEGIMQWAQYNNVSNFYNSNYIHVRVGQTAVCSVQFWAAGFGVDCGYHNHSELNPSNTFCELHVSLYNGSGVGGMTIKTDKGDQRLPLPEGHEHRPLWNQRTYADRDRTVVYPTHRYLAGPRPSNVPAGEQRFDVWVAFEHRPIPLWDTMIVSYGEEVAPEHSTEAVAPRRLHNKCRCSFVGGML
eukprot:m51a1_g9193 putative glycoside hydrolase family 31 protein (2599) ;mRNA; r:85268-95290